MLTSRDAILWERYPTGMLSSGDAIPRGCYPPGDANLKSQAVAFYFPPPSLAKEAIIHSLLWLFSDPLQMETRVPIQVLLPYGKKCPIPELKIKPNKTSFGGGV